jgi:hypothetical protein
MSPNEKALDLSKKESSLNDNKSEQQDITLPSFPGVFKNAQQGLQLPSIIQPIYISQNGLFEMLNMQDLNKDRRGSLFM